MSEPSDGSAQERELWRRWKMTAGDTRGWASDGSSRPDELTLAAFAEGRLTGPARAAVEAYLAADPDAADDVEAACRLAATSGAADDAALAATIARAASLVADPTAAGTADRNRRHASVIFVTERRAAWSYRSRGCWTRSRRRRRA